MSWRALVACLAFGPLAAGAASATETVTVSIRATVLTACRFGTSAPNAVMGRQDRGVEEASALITYRCAKGVAPGYALAVDVACPQCLNAAEIAPSLATPGETKGGGMGPSNDRMLVVRIAPDAVLSADANAGTVRVSLSP